MVLGYLSKFHPGRQAVLRHIRDAIFGPAVAAPLPIKRPCFGAHNTSAFLIPSPAITQGSQHVTD
jgi:hypothetical protein